MNPFDLFTGESKKQLAAALDKNAAKMDEAMKLLSNQGQQNGAHVVALTRTLSESLQAALDKNSAKMEEAMTLLSNQGEQNGAHVVALTKTFSDSLQSIERGLQGTELQKVMVAATDKVASLDSFFKDAAVRPIPVQTFPITDDFRFEKEKQQMARNAGKRLLAEGEKFVTKLKDAHKPVDLAICEFFSLIDKARNLRKTAVDNPIKAVGDLAATTTTGKAVKAVIDPCIDVLRTTSVGGAVLGSGEDPAKELQAALDGIVRCSPKKIIANFQKYALEAGWTFVCEFNELIDELARQFPRCRAGIYASRLNYSDVLQISDEVLSTLRATSTLLEDLQRRYDLLDALQNELKNDLTSNEIDKIWDAIYASIKDTLKWGEDSHGWKKFVTIISEVTLVKPAGALVAGAIAGLSAPGAQFQGQLAREQRVRVFFATSLMLQQGWKEWSERNAEIVVPNLEILFILKGDYVRNKILCICDLVSANGYSLADLPNKFDKIRQKEISA